MKVAVNIEFTDEEILKHGSDIGRRVAVDAIRQGAKEVRINPHLAEMFVTAIVGAVAASKAPPQSARPEPAAQPEPAAAPPSPSERRCDDPGELVVDEDKIRALGAIDAESVRENRRLKDIVNKKRSGMKGVLFNAGDVLIKYETLIKLWPINTIDISVKRLTGSPVQHMILSRPRSGAELYGAIRAVHGQYEEAEYELKFFDNNSKEFRGNGQITMPDTRAAASPQPQPSGDKAAGSA
jgi:hypothetical protein